MRGAAEALQSTIYYARSEAIKRGGGVTIYAIDNADWANGWEVLKSGNDALQETSALNRAQRNHRQNHPAPGPLGHGFRQ